MKRFKKHLKINFKLLMRRQSTKSMAFLFLFVLTFSLVGIGLTYKLNSQGQIGTSTFSQWNSYQDKKAARDLASQKETCSEGFLSTSKIESEITGLEALYESGHKVEGNWYGIDLGSLPAIQAQLLADHGSLIGNKNHSQNYRECKDVICVFNKIYRDKSELSGKLVYFWYLKTGSMLSLSNLVPGQASKYPGKYQSQSHKLTDYLFSLEELKKFYNLAKALPSKFIHNPLLRSIHKIPNELAIEREHENRCSKALVSGQILIGSKCLPEDEVQFSINISEHIAEYIDQYYALNHGTLYSQSEGWLKSSQWEREQIWDYSTNQFKQAWISDLDKKHFLTDTSKLNPSQQFSSLLAAYRFRPNLVQAKTPIELRNLIKDKFFYGESFDANGLYENYLTKTVSSWKKQESTLWKDCLDEHYNASSTNRRELASELENPLYSCVENKVPSFIEESISKLKQEKVEACEFFNDTNKYGHVSKRYRDSVSKFLSEQVLKRKIELQNHGSEVLQGLVAKDNFLSTVDPGSLFINCFKNRDSKTCFNQSISVAMSGILDGDVKFTSYYKDVLQQDIASLFPYSEVEKRTEFLAKRFLTPFNSQINFAAQELWSSCKRRSSLEKPDLSLFFSGGSKYVKASLLNCISDKVDERLAKIVDQGSFHAINEKQVNFKLNPSEKKFALTFMKSKMKQAFYNILDEELKLERHRVASHFSEKLKSIQKHLKESKGLLSNAYGIEQVKNQCLSAVQKSYPKRLHYHSQTTLDKQQGRKICSSFVELPEVNEEIKKNAKLNWEKSKKEAVVFLDKFFSRKVSRCNNSFPRTLGENFEKNAQLRKECIEDAYKESNTEALAGWSGDKNLKYYQDRSKELSAYLDTLSQEKISRALK